MSLDIWWAMSERCPSMHLELKIKITLKCRPKGYLKYDISVSLKCKLKHLFWRLFIAIFINNDMVRK
jgi:hypothetical protein